MRLLLTIISFVGFFNLANAETLSNLMPTDLVRSMYDNKLWEPGWDDNYGPGASDMMLFWKSLTTQPIKIDDVFKALTSSSDNRSQVYFPRLYPVKIFVLRYLRKTQPQIYEPVFQAWMHQYIETALTLIDPSSSGLTDFAPVVPAFQKLLRSGFLTLLDLSPEQRKKFDIDSSPSHGHAKLEEKDSNGQYVIFGRYNNESKILAIDFGQDIYKTLVTIAHEIVHASDPVTDARIREFQNAIPKVTQILARWLGNTQITLPLIERIFSQILFEKNPNAFFARDSFNQNLIHVQELKKILLAESGPTELTFKPSEQEAQVLENFFRAYIGITIENEYRAYGLSWALFLVPQYRYLLSKPNQQEQDFLKEIIEGGDGLLLRRLQLMLNPFPDLRISYPKQLEEYVKGTPKAQQEQLVANVGRAINFLDLAYTETLEKVLKDHTERFSQLFNSLQQRQKERPDLDKILPFRAGSDEAFDSSYNPYQILTARLTTLHIILFQGKIRGVLENLRTTNLSLLLTQAGIFDFHNLTIGEQKLVGLLYSKCNTSNVTPDFSSVVTDLRKDLDFVESEIIGKFELVECPVMKSYLDDIVTYETLRTNFLRLKLARVYYWLERSFPIFDASLKSLRRFHDLLYRGEGYSKEEISDERAAYLRAEIEKAFELSQFSRDEMNRYQILVQYLSTYMELASEAGWKQMHDNVEFKLKKIREILELQKIYETASNQELDTGIFQSARSLQNQIMPYQKKCEQDCQRDKKRPNMVCRVTLPISDLTALGQTFSVNSACMNNRLYMWRQPNDSLKPFTVLSHEPTVNDPRPFTRLDLFGVSRKFELMPFGIKDNLEFDNKAEQYEKQQKKQEKGFWQRMFGGKIKADDK